MRARGDASQFPIPRATQESVVILSVAKDLRHGDRSSTNTPSSTPRRKKIPGSGVTPSPGECSKSLNHYSKLIVHFCKTLYFLANVTV